MRFREIVRFELRYARGRLSTWVYAALFFTGTGLVVAVLAGAFGTPGLNERELINSPQNVAGILAVLNLLQMIVAAAIFGGAAQRDYEVGIFPLFFSTPTARASYFFGRFLGALLVNLGIALAAVLAVLVTVAMPFIDAERVAPFRLLAYLQPLLLFTLPNLLIVGAVFFSLAALTRQMLAVYAGSVGLLVAYFASMEFIGELEQRTLAALLDPFGFQAVDVAIRYWTIAEQNTRLLPTGGVLLGNRLLWLGVGLAVLALGYRFFRFAYAAPERRRRRAAAEEAREEAPAHRPGQRLHLPAVRRDFGWRTGLAQYRSLARSELKGIVANVYFRAIVLTALIFLGVSAYNVGKLYGTTTYPLTYVVLDALGTNFTLFLMVLIAFQSGELVWRDRERRISGITDSTPTPTRVWFAAKWTALVGMVAVLLAVVMLFGIATQLARGFTDIELGLYLQELFGVTLLNAAIWCVFALTVHVVANHKYLGHLLVIGFFVGVGYLSFLGFEHSLYRFNSGGVGMYSDMNGYGYRVGPYFVYKLYWGFGAVLLAVLANLLWVRGSEAHLRVRWPLAERRFRGALRRTAAVASLGFVALGGFIFYNTNVLNEYTTSKARRKLLAAYEKQYKRYEHVPQPRVVDVNVRVELYPETGDLRVAGRYWLKNRTSVAIDSVHLNFPGTEGVIERLAFGRPSRRVLDDRELGYTIWRLQPALAPGDSVALDFRLAYLPRGFEDGGARGALIRPNGTFLNNREFLPSVGYLADVELSGDRERKKQGLAPKERMPRPEDPRARQDNFIAHDADWIRFQATLGTSADQIAVAPGYLQREWREGGRRYFHYRMDAPMLHFYSINSARYAVAQSRWRDVAIQVFHHPTHTYNVRRMMGAVQRSLDYYAAAFGPYQHRQVRILEFPRYAPFAQSFANTIPYSEGVGFIARVREDEDDVDYPFYITAHEVAHQWWGHQVVGAAAAGTPLLSESLSEYSALMVMEQRYGPRQMRKFLKHVLDEYLQGRTFESKRETPLLYAEGQQYVHYQKGGLAFYALRDALGEERLNAALRGYLQRVKFQQPPYTTSLELYRHLQAATPDSLRPFLADLFERITLYENRVTRARATRRPDGRYAVELTVVGRKVYADSLGNETDAPLNEWIDVGVFAAPPAGQDETAAPLYLRKHKLRSGEQTIRLLVDQQPVRAGVDPLHKLIDRHTDDNLLRVEG